MPGRNSRAWLPVALLCLAIFVVLDVALPGNFARSLYLLPVLAIAIRAPARDVALAGIAATVLGFVSPLWNDTFGSASLLPIITLVSGSAIAWWGARERQVAEEARSAAETERSQLLLLADAARITDGAAHIDEALRRLVDLLVPAVADAAWVDVIGSDGEARRIAARFEGDAAEVIEAWLMQRGAATRADLSPTTRALRGEGSQLAELTPDLSEAMSRDDDDRRLMKLSRLRSTMAIPLAPGGGPLGALGLGVGGSGRWYDEDDLRFATLLVGRAGLALANAQLVDRLTATQRRLDGILGSLAEAVTVQDTRGRMVYANESAARLLGLPDVPTVLTSDPADLAARFEIRHADGKEVRIEELPGYRVLAGESSEPLLTRSIYRATGEVYWFLTKATALEDETGELLAVNVIQDVSEEHEAALRERFLADAAQVYASSLDYGETLQRVAQLAVPALADWCAVELPDDRGRLEQVALAHVDPDKVAIGRALRERYPPDPDAPTGTAAVMRSGEPQLFTEIPDEVLVETARDPEQLEGIRALGLSSAMIVPMITAGRSLGAMTFAYAESGRRYGERDVAFARVLAGRSATALENSRLYTELADVAGTLQASLLPEQLPDVAGWSFAADYRPGQRGAEVGGDFYDIFEVDDGHVVLLGDVTGKGVTAASLTSLVRYTAKAAAAYDPRPSAVLAQVNRALRQRPRMAPVTMVSGLLTDGELTLAVGGHPLPLLKPGGGGPAIKVGETGMLLGAVYEYAGAQDVTVPVAPGDTLLLYTDGVTDTPGVAGRFGEARLMEAVDAASPEPRDLLRTVSRALDGFARGTALDDRAMLALRRAA